MKFKIFLNNLKIEYKIYLLNRIRNIGLNTNFIINFVFGIIQIKHLIWNFTS